MTDPVSSRPTTPDEPLEAVLEQVTTIARDVAAPLAAEIDREARWPESSLRALQAAGLAGLVVPREWGGLGFGLHGLAQVSRRLGRECASTALCFGMHCVGAAVISAKPGVEQRHRYLEPIVAGSHLTTLTLSEPGTGSHFWLPQTTISPVDDGFVLDGVKTFVTSGDHADSYVVSARSVGEHASSGEFSCVVVEHGTTGLEWGDHWDGLGMRGNSSRSVTLRQARVPSASLLGEPGDQIWYVFNVVAPYFLMAMAGTYLGIAEGAFEQARQHLVQRRHSHTGSRLAEEPVLQHRVGELWATIARTSALLETAARRAEDGHPDALPLLASAKAEASTCAVDVVNDTMTLVGGLGYRDGGAFGRRLRDARAGHVMSPTTDLLRLWTGRSVLGEHLLAD